MKVNTQYLVSRPTGACYTWWRHVTWSPIIIIQRLVISVNGRFRFKNIPKKTLSQNCHFCKKNTRFPQKTSFFAFKILQFSQNHWEWEIFGSKMASKISPKTGRFFVKLREFHTKNIIFCGKNSVVFKIYGFFL